VSVDRERRSFWKTLPGVITAIAGFLSAIGGILVAAQELGWIQIAQTATTPTQSTGEETTTEGPTDDDAIVFNAGDLILADNFDDATGQWDRINPSAFGGIIDYAGTQYRIYAPPSGMLHAAYPNKLNDPPFDNDPPKDIRVQVFASRAGDLPGSISSWGVTCRGRAGNAYFLGITSDGRGVIQKGRGEDLSVEPLAFSDHTINVRTKPQLTFRADCVGSDLTLYVDGSELVSVQDEEFGQGGGGLYVDNPGPKSPGTDVFFDNFSISRL